jgi:hypothetical protein
MKRFKGAWSNTSWQPETASFLLFRALRDNVAGPIGEIMGSIGEINE